MELKNFKRFLLLLCLPQLLVSEIHKPVPDKPNIILFLADDFGYGDLSSFGHPTQDPGPIDKMASEGMKFTQFYSIATFCTPSRTSLLTARLPQRSGMDGRKEVHLPCMNVGLPDTEITVAEALKDLGYKTGMVGKWHQGINKYTHDDGYYLPHNHGFDYVGTMLPHTLVWDCDTSKVHKKLPNLNKCFTYRNRTAIEQPVKLETLTSSILEDTQAFIHDHHDKPFFMYVSFPQIHTPMYANEHFRGKSRRGLLGDQINEMAWAVGKILDTIKQLGLDEKTLAIFTSDHGPHREMCGDGGSTGGLRGGKSNFNEGGVRIPTILRWPGIIPPNSVSHTVLTLMDLFPTLIELSGGKMPSDRKIDGRSFAPILLNNGMKTTSENAIHEILYFYCSNRELMAVRYKQYKIHFKYVNANVDAARRLNCIGTVPKSDYYHSNCMGSVDAVPPIIYDLHTDPHEDMPLPYEMHKQMIKDVWKMTKKHKKSLAECPKPLLDGYYCNRDLIPCCRPPYCMCV